MFGYHVPGPNEALIVAGRKGRRGVGEDDLPFRIVTGHGTFVLPVLTRASVLTLAMQEAEVVEDCYTQQGLTLAVRAVIAFKVGDDHTSIAAAARRFQSDQNLMPALVSRIFAGHLRSIIGSMTVESIIRDQQRLGDAILDASKSEMARIGLAVDSLQISQIDDKGVGYIARLAAPHQAEVDKVARIAQAQADMAAAQARQESERAQAEYARTSAVAKAQYQAEIDNAAEIAAQAGPLAAARAQQAVLEEQAQVAARNAALREAELVAEVVKPAEAAAREVEIAAQAEARALLLKAEAAASQGRIALDQQLIALLPDLISAAAEGLKGAHLTVLNGAEGLNASVNSILAQGFSALNAIKAALPAGQGASAAVPPETTPPALEADPTG